MDNPTKVFRDLKLEPGDVYGVFSVQGYVDEATELKQGQLLRIMGTTQD
jgi:cell envelope opacity-associated protein A